MTKSRDKKNMIAKKKKAKLATIQVMIANILADHEQELSHVIYDKLIDIYTL